MSHFTRQFGVLLPPRTLAALAVACAGALAMSGCASSPPARETAPGAPSSKPAAPTKAPPPAQGAARDVLLCRMAVSNPPSATDDGRIADADARVAIEGGLLLLAPVTDGCLSSGFGPRGGRSHKGVDYFSRGGDVIAAGDGVIREKVVRADFGNMILIEHGPQLFTRYAHLAEFAPGLVEGDRIRAGARLGPIGASGAAGAVHLHYEILTGAYVRGVGSFGLKAHDPFKLDRE